jgi:seryl-tRNA synthetase
MIDLKDYRTNPTKYHKGAADKGAQIDRAAFDMLDTMMKQTLTSIEALRTQRNELTTQIQHASKDQPDQITALKDQVKQIKTELETLEYDYDAMYGDF